MRRTRRTRRARGPTMTGTMGTILIVIVMLVTQRSIEAGRSLLCVSVLRHTGPPPFAGLPTLAAMDERLGPLVF